MASAGIQVSEESVAAFQAVKGNKHSYVTFKLNDTKDKVIPVATSGQNVSYDDFIKIFDKGSCIYAVYLYEYKSIEGGSRGKVVLFSWIPDNASSKDKMMYASTLNAVKVVFTGIATTIQASDESDLEQSDVHEKITHEKFQ